MATQSPKICFRHFFLILCIKSFLLIPHMTSIDGIMNPSCSASQKMRAANLRARLRGGCNSDHAWLFFGDSRHPLGPISEGISLFQILPKFCDIWPFLWPSIINLVSNKPEDATKFNTYRTVLNPGLIVHQVYSREQYVPDFTPIAFTRLRLMSHDLKIETGRWSRVPRDMRRCQCDGTSVQSEYHVLVDCLLTREIRRKFELHNIQNLNDIFNENNNVNKICNYIYDALNVYKSLWSQLRYVKVRIH